MSVHMLFLCNLFEYFTMLKNVFKILLKPDSIDYTILYTKILPTPT